MHHVGPPASGSTVSVNEVSTDTRAFKLQNHANSKQGTMRAMICQRKNARLSLGRWGLFPQGKLRLLGW